MQITKVVALQVFDSRGYPTIECNVQLSDGSSARAIVPSGASTGSKEAVELRDGEKPFSGKGVTRALENVNNVISPAVTGKDAADQQAIDKLLIELDGTDNKAKLGANATLAVSMAVSKAEAISRNMPYYVYAGRLINNSSFSIPMPQLNILNGGKHAEGSTDVQEFMIIPIGASDFAAAMQMASEVYHALGKLLKDSGYATTVGDEGGFAPNVKGGTEEALDLMCTAIGNAGYHAGVDISLALDTAASELYSDGKYDFKREGHVYNADELIDRYASLIEKYPIISIEDGLAEEDWQNWQKLNDRLGNKLQLVGDDLFVTNSKILSKGLELKAANAVLVKPNQIGTLSETLETVMLAKDAGWRTIISHRSGETEDVSIAHLAVGLNAGQIKTGSFARSERIAKYNELLRINNADPSIQLANPFKS